VLQVRVYLAILVPHKTNNTSFSHRNQIVACKGVLGSAQGSVASLHVFRMPFYIYEVENIDLESLCDSIKECAQNVVGKIHFICKVGGV
jgi:hypothetical protein